MKPTPELLVKLVSPTVVRQVWEEAWEPALALLQFQDGNDLTEQQLDDLVEYGTLTIGSFDEQTEQLTCETEPDRSTGSDVPEECAGSEDNNSGGARSDEAELGSRSRNNEDT